MKTTIFVNGIKKHIRPHYNVKSEENVHAFLKANNYRKSIFFSENHKKYIHVSLTGEITIISELKNATYSKIFNNLLNIDKI